MAVNINGYALASSSGLKFGAGNTKVVAANYGVVMPTLPGWFGSRTDGSPYKGYPMTVNETNLNIGAYWSGNRFTAPVAGIYYTSFGGIWGNGGNCSGYMTVTINDVFLAHTYGGSNSVWDLHHCELMVKVAAGDTIAWSPNTSPYPDTTDTTGAYSSNHNCVTMWLMG